MDRSIVQKEVKLHGTATFPVGVYDNYERYPQYSKRTLYLHWHDEAELTSIRKGAARFQIDDQEAVLAEREIALVPSGAIHTALSVDRRGFWFDAVVFDMNFLTSGMSDVTQIEYIGRLKGRQLQLPHFIRKTDECHRRVADELHVLLDAARRRCKGYEMGVKGSLYKILSELIPQGREAPSNHHRKRHELDRLKLVIQYVHDNYAQKLSLDDMAALSNLSKYYFCRFFKACIGKSPVDYLHYYRLLQAEQLLSQTNLKVVDIAHEVGFNDLSSFTRLFHRQTGVTPTRYRGREGSAISDDT
jgi:AraC-like DNA-binding protein